MAVNVKLLRTDAANKRPTAAQMDVGELALNYDQSTPGLYFEDDNGGVRKIGPVEVGSSAPNSSPVGQTGNSVGEMWLDNSATPNVLKVYDGSAWRAANLVEGVSTSATSTVLTLSNSAITLSQTLGFDSASDITFIDDSATALEFKQGSDTYLTFDTTNSAEKVVVNKALELDSTLSTPAITTDSSNRVGIGNTSPVAKLDIAGSGANAARIFITQGNDTTDGVDISAYRSRGTVASPTTVQASDALFKIFAQAHDGTSFINAGNAGWTASDGDGNSTFSIKTRVSDTLADRLTIDSSGNVKVANELIQSPGSSVTPANNGELMVEATNNTTLTFKLKGSDGTVRSGTLTLS